MATAEPLDLRDFDVPGRGRGILDVIQHRYLLRLLVRKGTATRYRNSVLGWTWSYVKPGAQFLIYYFVMGIILGIHRDVQNFAVYLFAGVVIVNLFNEAFGNATNAIVDNGSLVKKIYLPRELFPVAAIIVASVHFLPQIVILLAVCILLGWLPTLTAVGAFLLGTVLVLLFSLGLGLFFSGLNVRFRDAQNFVELIRMFSTWTSPVLYTWSLVANELPAWAFHVYMSNPLTVSVELFHLAFWEPTTTANPGLPPHFGIYLGSAVIVTVLFLIIGQLNFRRFERTFAQDL
ncbi:ABC transporter permease [Microbacterium sp. 18062]|uniref:ABC transporter permease n=1 Tax=Microbacterium sp. 18062 TaxID=2681410 RepID=UPI001359C4C4|nr:ABC transporter permease [Microbacterium sp. 18062]